jgi:EAL domain-containing protein (putative c-di-GMP-specific phosphodiesterase class I)/CheY-like chemotaxis protein
VLVIDDDPAVLHYVARCLAHSGFWVCLQSSGATGIEAARNCTPDVIVCDVTMPDVDGHAVLRAVRADPATREIPFIFLTAKQERRDIRTAMQLGADDYLPKPFSIEELVEAVRARLDRKWQMVERESVRIRDMAQRIDANSQRSRDDDGRLRLLDLGGFADALRRAAERDDSIPQSLAVFRWKDADRVYQELGPAAGEELQRQFDKRFLDCLRFHPDAIAFGRAGLQRSGLLFEGTSLSAHEDAAQRILAEMTRPYRVEGKEVFAQFCAGLSRRSDVANGRTAAERSAAALLEAEAALGVARPLAGSRLIVHDGASMPVRGERMRLDADLHHAVERGELRLHFQPQVDMRTDEVVGFEALVRWQHRELGMVSPAEFIAIAERNGSIRSIGDWVLRESCRQMASWLRQGASIRHVAVNVSAVQMEEGLVDLVRDALRESGLAAHFVQLEITESALLSDMPRAMRILESLRATGCSVAIDDFGVGYSSLCYLRQFKFDVLKIDRSFVMDLEREPEKVAICEMILHLARLLRFEVVAEGVETVRAKDLLTNEGCRYGQGYLFSRPLPQEVLTCALWSSQCAPLRITQIARGSLTMSALAQAVRLPVRAPSSASRRTPGSAEERGMTA